MCATGFNYILIGAERMILCKKTDFVKRELDNRDRLLKITKAAFPELFKGYFHQQQIKKIRISVVGCRKLYSSQFDCQVCPQENNNDWERNPFIALWILSKENRTFCGAKPIDF